MQAIKFCIQYKMGRILSVDYGIKRTGLAVTDPMRIIANALETVPTKEIFNYLENYFAKEIVDLIVVGNPKQMNGKDSETKIRIEEFVRGLNKRFPNLKVEWFDERFTSVLAHKTILESGIGKKARQNKNLTDKIAAVIILQDYMESFLYNNR